MKWFICISDLVCDPDNDKDILHDSGQISSGILHWMTDGERRLTRDNYVACQGGAPGFYRGAVMTAFLDREPS